jgi:hypothetical protein
MNLIDNETREDIKHVRKWFKHENKKIVQKIGELLATNNQDVLQETIMLAINNICVLTDKYIRIDMRYLTLIAGEKTYEVITDTVVNVIEQLIKQCGSENSQCQCVAHICMKGLSPTQIVKHKKFIKQVAESISIRFADNLKNVYIHNPGFIFDKAFALCKGFLDEDTIRKYIIVDKKYYEE